MAKAQMHDEEPISIPDAEAGFFESIGYKVTGVEAPVAEPAEDKGSDDLIGTPEVDLSELTIPQLREYAKEQEIDLSGADLKADILARVLKEK